MREYEICETCKGNHYETDKDGNYHLCSGCRGVDIEKPPADTPAALVHPDDRKQWKMDNGHGTPEKW